MKLRTGQLLNVTGMNRERFNGTNRDGNLPFYVSNDDRVSSWASFSPTDAFKLRLMIELMGGDHSDAQIKLLARFACRVVQNAIGYAETDDPTHFAKATQPIFLGAAEFSDTSAKGDISFRAAWFCGPISAFERWVDAQNAEGKLYGETVLNRMVLVNATEAAKHVLGKIAALGLTDEEPGK